MKDCLFLAPHSCVLLPVYEAEGRTDWFSIWLHTPSGFQFTACLRESRCQMKYCKINFIRNRSYVWCMYVSYDTHQPKSLGLIKMLNVCV